MTATIWILEYVSLYLMIQIFYKLPSFNLSLISYENQIMHIIY